MTNNSGDYHGGVTTPEEALDALTDLAERFSAIFESGARDLGLTPQRARLIYELRLRGGMRQRALAEATGMSTQQLAVMVDALVGLGLVERRPDPSDRRAVLVELTVQGQDAAAAIHEVRARVGERLLGDLSSEELRTIQDLATRLAARTHEPTWPLPNNYPPFESHSASD